MADEKYKPTVKDMKDALKSKLSHERHMLKEWKHSYANQDAPQNIPPKGWSIEKQKHFIQGMKYALLIITKPHAFLD